MHQLENYSPFECQSQVNIDQYGADCLVLGVKATFDLHPSLKVSDEQRPFVLADEYLGDPNTSSLLYAAEMLPPKPGCDVIVNGHAYAPDSRAVEAIDTRVSIAQFSKTIRVFGDRLWVNGGMSHAVPFEKMPLCYERAFGGMHHFKPEEEIGSKSMVAIAENPVGRGFIGKRSSREMIGQPLPNLEDPRYLIRVPQDTPKPMSYGYASSFWSPRRELSGTYDEVWSKTRAPLLPLDFDTRFLLNGSSDLRFERTHFKGGESVRLQNLGPFADIQFQLPNYELKSYFKLDGSWYESPLAIETILIEPDADQLVMIWKTQFKCNKKVRRVSHIRLDIASDAAVKTA